METLRIGTVEIEKTAALAPMAGVADRAFRQICREFGCAYVVSEMVSAKGMTYGDKKSAELLAVTLEEQPMAVQLFGDEPLTLARAAEMAMAEAPSIIDLNMGCPAPKIAGSGGGCALMKRPELAAEIIREVAAAVPVPVTVKFRKGWDDQTVNGVEFAKMAEQSGAAAIAIHGRTRAQMYAPSADWEFIRQVKESVSVPVIGNGDVDSPQAAKAMYEQTGVDLVMVGRGAMGAPWLFEQIKAFLESGELLEEPALEIKMEVMLRHLRKMAEYKTEKAAMREARKHIAWYMKGLRGAAEFRRIAGTVSTLAEAEALVEQVLAANRQD